MAQRLGQPQRAAALWESGWRHGALSGSDDLEQRIQLHLAAGTPARAAELLAMAIEQGVLEQPLHSSDWLQTAEVLESIDLLVSVDTSVAHLAGALGIPTVLMLSAPADWRWGQSGRQTFLYDAMRLVRCAAPGDWSQALQQADLEVNSWFGSTRSEQ